MAGTNSTKGVGKTTPLKSEFEVWDDNVTVPCGRPVSSSSTDGGLLYNEYIVYDTAQVSTP
jgi:poly [ADP-ribose] polymerase 1